MNCPCSDVDQSVLAKKSSQLIWITYIKRVVTKIFTIASSIISKRGWKTVDSCRLFLKKTNHVCLYMIPTPLSISTIGKRAHQVLVIVLACLYYRASAFVNASQFISLSSSEVEFMATTSINVPRQSDQWDFKGWLRLGAALELELSLRCPNIGTKLMTTLFQCFYFPFLHSFF